MTRPAWASRPDILGTRHAVVAGHPLAAQAAFRVLEGGGNAIDAGVTGGICLGVLHPDIVNFAGVAPTLVFDASRREAVSVAGVGPWPRRASVEFFRRTCGGEIPEGILRTIVPGAPDAWITLLERHGTIGFAEAVAPAIELARDGFPMGRFVAQTLAQYEAAYRRWPASAAIFLPNGRPPRVGERFVQADWARTLTYLADQDRGARRRGRVAGLRAARDAFYRGDVAERIVAYHRQEGGLLTREDLAEFQVEVEAPCRTAFREHEILTQGFWGQGPVLLQMLNLLAPIDLGRLGHNSAAYLHVVTEAMKLAFADREAYYGDPRHVAVPATELLSRPYAEARRRLLDEGRAWPDLPPPGDPRTGAPVVRSERTPASGGAAGGGLLGTSYIAVADAAGNAFSCTPSDVSTDTPVIPGLGFPISSRGSQSWLDPGHPSAVGPGKRPRITQCPALVLRDGRPAIILGTPGGDVQPQTILQLLLGLLIFGHSPQGAVEAPRIETKSMPDSFWPHGYTPGRLRVEQELATAAGEQLRAWGHRVEPVADWDWQMGSACVIRVDDAGVRWAAADPRRDSYALAW
jgi:gamma-glutamyltranspeptidase/glutathione hydrolase